MIGENNIFTFTNRLNYSVSEISAEEFLSVLSAYGRTEEDRKRMVDIEQRLYAVA